MTKEKPTEKNIHSGHRMRVLNSYNKIELDSLSPHQVLEYILFYVFPRGDVNPLAHRLLDRFGSVQDVLNAEPSELEKVYGISTKSAQMICGFSKIFDYYTTVKLARKQQFKTSGEIYDYCEELLRFCNREAMYFVGLDATNHVIAKRLAGEENTLLVSVDTHELCDFINECKPAYILLCHSHPGKSCQPSDNDIAGNNILKNVAEFMHCRFVDHLVVGDDGIFSIENNKKVREFSDGEKQIKN